jgi:hypothetical protein
MTHRAPEEAEVRTSLRQRVFQEKYLPHIAMAAVSLFYVAFYVTSGIAAHNFSGAAVPQTISVAWTGTLATWFGYCIRQRSVDKGES